MRASAGSADGAFALYFGRVVGREGGVHGAGSIQGVCMDGVGRRGCYSECCCVVKEQEGIERNRMCVEDERDFGLCCSGGRSLLTNHKRQPLMSVGACRGRHRSAVLLHRPQQTTSSAQFSPSLLIVSLVPLTVLPDVALVALYCFLAPLH